MNRRSFIKAVASLPLLAPIAAIASPSPEIIAQEDPDVALLVKLVNDAKPPRIGSAFLDWLPWPTLGRADLVRTCAYPDIKLAVMIQGDTDEQRKIEAAKDLEVSNWLGWVTLRFSRDEIRHHPEFVTKIIREVAIRGEDVPIAVYHQSQIELYSHDGRHALGAATLLRNDYDV